MYAIIRSLINLKKERFIKQNTFVHINIKYFIWQKYYRIPTFVARIRKTAKNLTSILYKKNKHL